MSWNKLLPFVKSISYTLWCKILYWFFKTLKVVLDYSFFFFSCKKAGIYHQIVKYIISPYLEIGSSADNWPLLSIEFSISNLLYPN